MDKRIQIKCSTLDHIIAAFAMMQQLEYNAMEMTHDRHNLPQNSRFQQIKQNYKDHFKLKQYIMEKSVVIDQEKWSQI
jgi:hypothetical protein